MSPIEQHFCSEALMILSLFCSQMNQKRKQLKKDGKPTVIEEDDPEVVTESALSDPTKLLAVLCVLAYKLITRRA